MQTRYHPITLLGLIALTLTGCSQTPNYSTTDLNGQVIHLRTYRGKWVFINYYASWCKPCWQEMPALNEFAAAHPKDVVILGVNYDQTTTQDRIKIAAAMGTQFPTLTTNPAQVLNFGALPGLPVTYVLNPKGKFVDRLMGAQTLASLKKSIA